MKTAWTLLWSLGELTLVYLATVRNIHGAQNVITGLGCLSAFLGIVILGNLRELKKEIEVRPLSLLYFCDLSDFIQTITLIWFGWFWLGFAYFIGTIAGCAYRHRNEIK